MHEELTSTEITPTLGETAARRADLYAALLAVEHAISRPGVGREPDWVDAVLQSLRDLDHEINEHIEVTERPDGLYDEIMETAPRLAGRIQRLRDEHPVMRDTTRELIARLESTPVGESWPLDDARDELQRLLGLLVRHRQRGADLVWEGYSLDIGGIG